MDSRTAGYVLLAIGALAIVAGVLTLAGLAGWFGHLPGDIRHNGRNVKVFAPITSMLLISIVLSLALALIARLR